MNVFKSIAVIGIVSLTSTLVSAQTNQLETDQGIAASIAPYDADVRLAILRASEYPVVLEHLQKNQNQSVASFQQTIGRFNQKKQTWFYTLTRYPDLMHTLATLPDKQSEPSVYKLLPNQDPDLKEAAWKLYRRDKKDLVKVDNINIAAQQEFEATIQHLDGLARAAFQKLATMPDVLSLLTNNVELTSRLGQHYRNNPSQLTHHLTALHDSLEVQNQYEAAVFKQQMADDPQAMSELSQAGTDYANSNGYDPSYQNYANNPYYNNPGYYSSPYSFWFGYPSWYSSPYWYPGFGYNSGFYFGSGGYGLYGFPSYGFSNWFFNEGYYRRYPRLYHQFGNYYHSNVSGNRVMGSVNRGFMGVANNHFHESGQRLNTLTSPSQYNRQGGQQQRSNGGRYATPSNANTYHNQSWGGYGGRTNTAPGGFRGGVRGGAVHGGGGHSNGGGHGGRR